MKTIRHQLTKLLSIGLLIILGSPLVGAADEVSTRTDSSAVEEIAQLYITATYEGDADTLKKIFHESAVMNGYLGGELRLGKPDFFIEHIATSPSLKSEGAPYEGTVDYVHIEGRVGTATITETGFGDMNFTNYLSMIEENGDWKIISKTYTSH